MPSTKAFYSGQPDVRFWHLADNPTASALSVIGPKMPCAAAATMIDRASSRLRHHAYEGRRVTWSSVHLIHVNDRITFFDQTEYMNRHRTRRTAKEVEQDFPHFVDIAVPPSGLGSKLAAMYDFHARHRISPKRGHGRREDRGGTIRWCFADPALADAFAQEFVRD